MRQSWRVRYAIDSNDTIDFVNKDWDAFAFQNSGAEVLGDKVLGRSIWDFMADAQTCEFYRIMLEQVRGGRGPIQFGFRCDADSQRRFLGMNIARSDNYRIEFTVTPIVMQTRRAISLLHPDAERLEQMVTVCSWCKRVRCADARWLEIEEAMPLVQPFRGNKVPRITHGMCADCLATETRLLNEHVETDYRMISFGELAEPDARD
ncbi:MAG: hypothetical protein IT366_24770 [Candidatus Hydrogenedentes bacterium]|nr:hypothetical protein [Candidatus Hydrogenedentota bacterium]